MSKVAHIVTLAVILALLSLVTAPGRVGTAKAEPQASVLIGPSAKAGAACKGALRAGAVCGVDHALLFAGTGSPTVRASSGRLRPPQWVARRDLPRAPPPEPPRGV
ncbi:hypothetical protein K1T73_05695 [Roseovarius sp. SCSIO 43702]|uniref:hypothetical protein n=1 Tax=Roseovarius sp. SCSIO 43702 TaxID=2823043 RepID=UPI001C738F51|nr:hypothetical protein [Roseovarius sp. SCSIO 43702]QYX57880.1 hypothetical protein K1T73_05695 [Roseovarius sp. SCSIO 43702]